MANSAAASPARCVADRRGANVRVAVLGAGALGRVYGVHLAEAGEQVSFVVRPSRLTETRAFVIQRRNGDRLRRQIAEPRRVSEIPPDTALILLAVRADQLNEDVERLLQSGPEIPVVALTPLLPLSLARLEGWTAANCFVAMPALASSEGPDGVDEYWAFRASPSLFEERDVNGNDSVRALVVSLRRSRLPARSSRDVRQRNPATTIAFFPISVAVSRAGGVEPMLANPQLASLGAQAAREALVLAQRIGPIELPLVLALRGVTPRTLRWVFSVVGKLLPEANHFVDSHFGTKLQAQHRVLGAEILELGRAHGVALPSLERLLD